MRTKESQKCMINMFTCQSGVQQNGSQKPRDAQCCISRLTASYINPPARNSTTRFFFDFFQPNPRGPRSPRDHLFQLCSKNHWTRDFYCRIEKGGHVDFVDFIWIRLKKGKKGKKESGGTVFRCWVYVIRC